MRKAMVAAWALALSMPMEAMAAGAGRVINIKEDEVAFTELRRIITYVAGLWFGPSVAAAFVSRFVDGMKAMFPSLICCLLVGCGLVFLVWPGLPSRGRVCDAKPVDVDVHGPGGWIRFKGTPSKSGCAVLLVVAGVAGLFVFNR
jgi:hypothetical protein